MKRRDFISTAAMVPVALKVEAMTKVFKVPLQKGSLTSNMWSYPMYYYKDGTPIWYGPGEANAHKATVEWARLFEDFGYRRIGDTTLPNGIRVSTVWMGLNHAYLPTAPKQIFESMAFAAQEKVHKAGEHSFIQRDFTYHDELDCERYETEDEALRGHMHMCEKFFAGALTLGGGA